ncbi:hypothetical protein OG455_39570 [Kitasatospora sp. NBC_01287]|uniref:hypothetical protein n=1 Tax=Kitasatospora sp. NBC_01287 TaxID=2903573 RepID=UPI002251616E|nr:hypothetical protein [Kitasatospora sp. NBC_01287]MCX4751536.1 hypothetical protein [Kitasatospora sp. NBC_01287]
MRRAPNRRTATGVTALALITVATGCTSQPGHSAPAGPPPPQSRQAASVASEEFGLLAGGGWAQAWSLWTDSAHQVISQADFVRLNTECRPVPGVPYVVDRTTIVDSTTVRIDWHRADATGGNPTGGNATGSNTLLYQAGRWQFVPDAASLADYRLGVDQLVQKRRAAGSCH